MGKDCIVKGDVVIQQTKSNGRSLKEHLSFWGKVLSILAALGAGGYANVNSASNDELSATIKQINTQLLPRIQHLLDKLQEENKGLLERIVRVETKLEGFHRRIGRFSDRLSPATMKSLGEPPPKLGKVEIIRSGETATKFLKSLIEPPHVSTRLPSINIQQTVD